MASVQETKDALDAARDQALKTAETAVDAINTVIAFSQWSLGILGVSIAVLGLIGVTMLYRNGIRQAEKVANDRLDAYLESSSFSAILDAKLEQVAKQAIVIQHYYTASNKPPDEDQPFPEAKEDNQ